MPTEMMMIHTKHDTPAIATRIITEHKRKTVVIDQLITLAFKI